jgi:cysteine synthase A
MDLVGEMAARHEQGSIVTLLCDDGERYACTYYDDAWLRRFDLDWRPAFDQVTSALGL